MKLSACCMEVEMMSRRTQFHLSSRLNWIVSLFLDSVLVLWNDLQIKVLCVSESKLCRLYTLQAKLMCLFHI